MNTPLIDLDKGKSVDSFHNVSITDNVSWKRSISGCNALFEGQSSWLKKHASATEFVECKVQSDLSSSAFVSSRFSSASTNVTTVVNYAHFNFGSSGYVDEADCQK
ncbi:hypothetical protein RIF29_03775 [Crotalaria pallida]|uniref:Uncharacterized protein n=1 Tax=Crotalaria pallida TaxID=3830 RepID=A0AAN9J115_CROPI